MKRLGWALLLLLGGQACNTAPQSPTVQDIRHQMELGNFATATQLIKNYVAVAALSPQERMDWEWEIDKMARISIDFQETPDEALPYLKRFLPDVTPEQIAQWEQTNALENWTIDGEKRYFNNAPRNLFRIDTACKAAYNAVNPPRPDAADSALWRHIDHVMQAPAAQPVQNTYRITYQVTIPKGTIPEGEWLRVWMPLPRTDNTRQSDFRLLSTSQPDYIIAPPEYAHRSLYMQGKASDQQDAVFSYTFTYTAAGQYHAFDVSQVKPYDTQSERYQEYTAQRLPHIVLDQRIREMAQRLVGSETNPFLKLQKIFTYINDHYPWASAREYSTIDCIPLYVLDNGHGDCGQVTLLLISLCRAAGIPARWESGWFVQPDAENLHDWAEVYFEGIGWVPVDQSFGVQSLDTEEARLFYTHGIDAFRMAVNNDISGAFYPAKTFPRSETVDFQRGEVEWRGGNLYFDKWDYHLEVAGITTINPSNNGNRK